MIKKINSKYQIPGSIKFKIHKAAEGGYWAESKTFPGLLTQGETFDELSKNIEDAILTYFDVSAKVSSYLCIVYNDDTPTAAAFTPSSSP